MDVAGALAAVPKRHADGGGVGGVGDGQGHDGHVLTGLMDHLRQLASDSSDWNVSFRIPRVAFDKATLPLVFEAQRIRYDYNTDSEILTIMLESGAHARTGILLQKLLESGLSKVADQLEADQLEADQLEASAAETAAAAAGHCRSHELGGDMNGLVTTAKDQISEHGHEDNKEKRQQHDRNELRAFLADVRLMGPGAVKLASGSFKSPDGSFTQHPAKCPTVICLVALSQSWDAVLEEAEAYLLGLYPALRKVLVLKMHHVSPNQVLVGGDVRVAAMAPMLSEKSASSNQRALEATTVVDKFVQKDGRMCCSDIDGNDGQTDISFALEDFANMDSHASIARLKQTVRLPISHLQELVRDIEKSFGDAPPAETTPLDPVSDPAILIKHKYRRPTR
ncbi:hypothetical protein UCRPA7_4977 [Phaeoacremonium minimum UCRPA7]|uniref:Uncharacterized protein n=1 Tax=Phaeoacremonium minimum (strain UCR-PA7) TaxID=1286976 RepID=R8BJI8_PHAM7|nr:hypothetical protein UCRPA7_4977 [Phaeoacremonium minimum UCRPA7]EON99490.1 hypothetical protein UCRPA7_4977 [Phaeoacremonium minimum UCRPA7]